MTSQTRPRVFIVDDHGLFRSGVKSELGDEVEVVGEAEDVAHSIDRIAATAGFGSATSLREHFRRVVATSPQAYRRAFRSRARARAPRHR